MPNDDILNELDAAYSEFQTNLSKIQQERREKFLKLMQEMDEEDIKHVKQIIQNL